MAGRGRPFPFPFLNSTFHPYNSRFDSHNDRPHTAYLKDTKDPNSLNTGRVWSHQTRKMQHYGVKYSNAGDLLTELTQGGGCQKKYI
jgi:hypothetical protein